MLPIRWRLLAAASLLALAGLPAADARPIYGGTLRVETRAASLEPARNFLLSGLVYEHLTRFAPSGELAPELALTWRADPSPRRWRFDLRPGVRFHDGSSADAAALAAILQPLTPAWRWTAEGSALLVTLDRPIADLPALLAQPAYAITRPGPDGLPLATGPFRIASTIPARQVILNANTAHWAGRPFLDAIEIALNRTPREQAVDFELRRADLVELSTAESRRATQAGRTVTQSLPKQLIALRLEDSLHPLVRRALALSIDRGSMHAVLLQKHGEVTAALLPQWLSGWAFVYPTSADPLRARQSLGSTRLNPVLLYADPADATLRSIADRIGVNARDIGITVRVITANPQSAHGRLERVSIDTPEPALALAAIASALALPLAPLDADPQATYAAEARLLDTHTVVPLFHLPQSWLWAPRVRMWLEPGEARDGSLNLANAWILEERPHR